MLKKPQKIHFFFSRCPYIHPHSPMNKMNFHSTHPLPHSPALQLCVIFKFCFVCFFFLKLLSNSLRNPPSSSPPPFPLCIDTLRRAWWTPSSSVSVPPFFHLLLIIKDCRPSAFVTGVSPEIVVLCRIRRPASLWSRCVPSEA